MYKFQVKDLVNCKTNTFSAFVMSYINHFNPVARKVTRN